MQRSQPDPDLLQCACGRPQTAAAVTSYRSPAGCFLFHRCDCGAEWTEQLAGVDHTQPVSSDEVLEVHQQLAQFRGGLTELVGLRPAG